MGFFDKLKKINIFAGFGSELDDDFYDELEESLILSDMGMDTTLKAVEELRRRVKEEHIKTVEEARACMCRILADMLTVGEGSLNLTPGPGVALFIGVNGVGKTTSIGKLAKVLGEEGRDVALVAADTFRAAAIEQLGTWAERSGATLIAQKEGADPASVVYDAIDAARHGRADTLIVDTAGRLQNKKNLMDELAKIERVIERELPAAQKEVLLVLDATMGQNAVSQAREFIKCAPITGIVLTKIDGSAKGGIVFALKKELGIGVRYIGVGEGMDDLRLFDPHDFVEALFAVEEDV